MHNQMYSELVLKKKKNNAEHLFLLNNTPWSGEPVEIDT